MVNSIAATAAYPDYLYNFFTPYGKSNSISSAICIFFTLISLNIIGQFPNQFL